MKKRFLLSVLILGLVAIGVYHAGRVQSARADEGDTTFTFTVIAPQVGGTDKMILNGHGPFNPFEAEVEGGGSFTRFDDSTSVPKTIRDSGTWQAKRFISFTSPGRYGAHEAGILVVEAQFNSANGTVTGATVTVFCNIAAGGLFNRDGSGNVIPGGVGVSLASGDTFRSIASVAGQGLTVFSPRGGND